MKLTANQLLGIECGGTKTLSLFLISPKVSPHFIRTGPANARLLTDSQLKRHFLELAGQLPKPEAIGIGAAGVREPSDCDRVARIAATVWRNRPILVNHDLETALLACRSEEMASSDADIIVLSGTGSCCYGKDRSGKVAKVGGWGHWLGDRGSGFDIGHRALRAVIEAFDHQGRWPRLGARLLRALQLNEPNALVDWVQSATKTEISALAVEVFAASKAKDPIARSVIQKTVELIAFDAVRCASQLGSTDGSFNFYFAGSVLLQQPRFAQSVQKSIRLALPNSSAQPLPMESVWGAIQLAQMAWDQAHEGNSIHGAGSIDIKHRDVQPDEMEWSDASDTSPTEQRNPRSMHLDELSILEAVDLMLSEDARMLKAVKEERESIARAVGLIAVAFRRKGRLFYVGAGTSGRLGVLDASECPPTFGVEPDQVQGIIAGGSAALVRAIEGAEDDWQAGRSSIEYRHVTSKDVVVGITASGRTPFVLGAIERAKQLKARTVLICFNPEVKFASSRMAHLVIAPDVGPEVLTGSTRLKAGTATKLILNLFTTLAMVQTGKVISNLMTDVQASNHKLKRRAVRILSTLADCEESQAATILQRTGWNIPKALKWFFGE